MKAAALSLMTTLAITLIAPAQAHAEIAWQTNLRTAHAQAQAEGKLLLLHFYSDNCSWCDKLEAGAFTAPGVAAAISPSFVPVKIHANATPKLAEMFKVTKFPTDVIVTVEGKTLAHSVSPQDPSRYVAMLTSTLTEGIPGGPGAPTQSMLASSQPPTANPAGTATLSTPTRAASPAPAQEAADWALPATVAPSSGKTQLASSQGGMQLPMPEELTTNSPTISDLEKARQADSLAPAAAGSTKTSLSAKSLPAPELAMDGYCAISVVDDAKWVEGSPEYGVIHLGKLYLFASEANMKKFLAQPNPYTPVLNEIDVVRFFEERVIVQGKREWAMQDPMNKRMFFFADEASMLHFENTYERYVDAAITVMDKAVKESNPGT